MKQFAIVAVIFLATGEANARGVGLECGLVLPDCIVARRQDGIRLAQANSDLTVVKTALAKLGLKPGPINGARDRRTFDSVRSFQATLGQPTTGTLTAMQRAELYRRSGAAGGSSPQTPAPTVASKPKVPDLVAAPAPAKADVVAPAPKRPPQVAGATFGAPKESYQVLARQFHEVFEDTDADLVGIDGANIDADGAVTVMMRGDPKALPASDGHIKKGTVHNLAGVVDGSDRRRGLVQFIEPEGRDAVTLIGRMFANPSSAETWARQIQSRLDRLAAGAGLGIDPNANLKPYRR